MKARGSIILNRSQSLEGEEGNILDGSFKQFRYMLANFILGNIPDVHQLTAVFGLDPGTSKLLGAFISNKPLSTLSVSMELLNYINEGSNLMP